MAGNYKQNRKGYANFVAQQQLYRRGYRLIGATNYLSDGIYELRAKAYVRVQAATFCISFLGKT